jgi:hypothetical protein
MAICIMIGTFDVLTMGEAPWATNMTPLLPAGWSLDGPTSLISNITSVLFDDPAHRFLAPPVYFFHCSPSFLVPALARIRANLIESNQDTLCYALFSQFVSQLATCHRRATRHYACG